MWLNRIYKPNILSFFMLCMLWSVFSVKSYAQALPENIFSPGDKIADVSHKKLDEISGMVASRTYPGVFWVHNDSGDKARIYAINENGELISQIKLDEADADDWEDIAIREMDGHWEIVIADIGDNRSRRDSVCLFFLREPDPFISEKQKTTNWSKQVFTYEDGPRDAEILMADQNGTLFIVTKRDSKSRLYELLSSENTARFVATYPFRMAVGGDWHPSGDLLIKTYDSIYYWPKITKIEVSTIERGTSLNYKKEKQGEAICWSIEANNFYTISERDGNKDIPFYRYQRIVKD